MIPALENKNLVLIVSGGRTGTSFMGRMLSSVIEDSFSVHEPDVLTPRIRKSWKRIKAFGFYHMVTGRLLGRTGIRNLSQQYLAGDISADEAMTKILHHRQRYYASIKESLIIESYYQWYGLLPLIREMVPSVQIACIVRDPRTWVRSFMNFGGHFDEKDHVRRFGQKRLDPAMIGDREYQERWPSMSPFARNCWHWKVISELLLSACDDNPNTRLFRFEQLFQGEDRLSHVDELLQFITVHEHRRYSYRLPGDLLDKPVNASKRDFFPPWDDWSDTQKQELDGICGPMMKRLGY